VGSFQCNCHVLADEATREAVIIDPGDEPEIILAIVKELGVTVKALLHTHCHLDHVIGTKAVKKATGAPIHIHRGDTFLYEGLRQQFRDVRLRFGLDLGAGEEPLPVDGFLEEGGSFAFGGQRIGVIHTPGHTPGSCCFSLETRKERILFSGDTLFAGGVGRTDLPGGDFAQEVASIRSKLFALDDETRVLPGHGPETRIEIEKSDNPFVR
jgi:glyoxylase-like metal-dependent hydrolase (beta-lactamase superfamily II)